MFGLFGNSNGERVALIDVSSSSVRAAYAVYTSRAPVRIVYETKVPIDVMQAAVADASMLRALDEALRILRSEGAPRLRKATGHGSVHRVVTSICAPWQRASLRVEVVENEKPFVFSESHLKEAFGKAPPGPGHIQTEETVVATLLNGYDTTSPLGKKAKRAEIIVLSASMAQETYEIMRKTLASFSHARDVLFSTFASVSYRAIRSAFPLQKEFLALRVSGEATELSFVKRGFPIATGAVSVGLNTFSRAAREGGVSTYADAAADTGIIDREKSAVLHGKLEVAEQAWVQGVRESLRSLAASHALPRTVFLVTDDEARGFISRLINASDLHSLWLSDEPLSVIALDATHFTSFIVRDTPFSGNAPVDLLSVAAYP